MINFTILETERMILKGITSEQMKSIFGELPKDEIKSMLGHRSEEAYLKEEYKHLNGYSTYNRRFLLFLMTDRETGLIIGRCGFHNWNKDHKRAEIGYAMEDEKFLRKGLMSEAVKAILQLGFQELELNRIEANVDIQNIPSIKILEKNNFRKEGILREHVYNSDHFSDSVLYSILRKEFCLNLT